MTPQISRFGRRAIAATVAGCCLLVAACSNDDTPDDSPPGTLAEGDETDLPDSSIDVSDGSGEGGNQSDDGGGTPQP